MDKIETDCIFVILIKVGPTFFKFMANRLDKRRFCSECDVTIILSVKKFHISYHFRVLNSG